MMKHRLHGAILTAVLLIGIAACTTQHAVTPSFVPVGGAATNRLSAADQRIVSNILAKLRPTIEERRRRGTHVTLSFDELYRPLDRNESAFLTALRNTRPESVGVRTPYLGFGTTNVNLVRLKEHFTDATGAVCTIPPQYLPEPVYRRYESMMQAMQKDIGRRLYVTSGYRSGAYQLYLFVNYLPTHDWSVQETARFVAFPGYSEHGDTSRQAIDFVNADNIADQPGEFEKLAEYRWLNGNAARFGFALSYPTNSPTGIKFEPWHWHAE